MPKLIEGYESAIYKSIRWISDMPYKIWNWREEYVALRGILFILKSEKKHPGKYFIRFMNSEYDLITRCGEIVTKGNIINLTTQNSIYEFEISRGVKECRENY